MASIKITYTAIAKPVADAIDQICATFVPKNAAADNAAFAGTYYATNVFGVAEGGIEKFVDASVAHPGLIAALKRAVEEGEYTLETEDSSMIMYAEEVAKAVADQGFVIEVSKN